MSLPSELSDETLVARAAQQDKDAFALVYDRYVRPVYGLAVHILGANDAEEITQDVFMQLWQKAAQFDPERGTFTAWFMTIARNYVMDALRKRGQHHQHIISNEIDQILANYPDHNPSVEDLMHKNELGLVMLAAIKILPDNQRQVIVLAYFGGMTRTAIADQLGLPLGTVKKRIRLGLQKLKQYWNEHNENESREN